MQLIFENSGVVRCVYAEAVDLASIGDLSIRRGSHVEPTELGQWIADLSPVNGPCLGPFESRSKALSAEAAWLEKHWLTRK